MPAFPRTFNARLTIALLLYALVTLVFLMLSLSTLLNRLASDQQDNLGEALSGQLAETLKQPVIDDNVISLQVILDNLIANTPLVSRATVYSPSNKILAQGQQPRIERGALQAYTRTINVDNTMLAQVRVELNSELILSRYRLPMWVSVAGWLFTTAIFAYWATVNAHGYTRRIRHLSEHFSTSRDAPPAGSELDNLEAVLEPFLGGNESDEEDFGAALSYSMLAISIPNLPKWRAQLNAEHFSTMLKKIDDLIDSHLTVFRGKRLQSRNTAMLLQFESGGDGHPVMSAIDCANALLHLSDSLISREGLPFEVRVTAAFRKSPVNGSPWRNDLEREECIDRLLDTLPLAGSWELVIDKTDLTEEDLSGCRVEDLSAASVWQFSGYTQERQSAFDKQVNFLVATLR